MQYSYITSLALSIAGLMLIDQQFKLAFFYDRKRTFYTLGLSVLLFLAWDIHGIGLGIFFVGNSVYDTGILLIPELPIEEPFFLLLLCYTTLIIFRYLETKWQRT
ncbi:lycopene cyclase domain-containing protein [Candidatus Saccharibacteria bacterium]|nr:lycopene cyclase domain-containing protein [Candidatus Saccharibacteria bacterium]